MSDGTNTIEPGAGAEPIPADAVDLPIVEDEIDDEPVNLEVQDDPSDVDVPEGEPEPNGDGEPEGPVLAQVEIDGQLYEVPEAIKDGYMRQADYTQKTQEAAELRKSYEAKNQQIEQLAQVSQEELQARAYAMNVEARLKQFQNVDWDALEAEDPIGTPSLFRQYQQLDQEYRNLSQYQQQLQGQRQQHFDQMTAERLRETAEYAQKKLKGWSPELDGEITNFAVQELGIDVDTLKNAYTPKVYEVLFRAHRDFKAEQNALHTKSQPSKAKAKPLSTVKGRSGANTTRVEEIDDMEAYAATRNRQMGIG